MPSILVPLLLVGSLAGFTFSTCVPGNFCDVFDNAVPTLEPSESGISTIFENPGTLIAYHGYACAELDKPGQESFVNVERSIDLPAYVTDATVFLNGWRLEYLHDDHDVADFGAAITRIGKEGQTLRWRATGVLSDENFDDGYSFCHYYTALAWNQGNLRLMVDHDDGSCPFDSSCPRIELVHRKA